MKFQSVVTFENDHREFETISLGFNAVKLLEQHPDKLAALQRDFDIKDFDHIRRISNSFANGTFVTAKNIRQGIAVLESIQGVCEYDLTVDFGFESGTKAIHESRTMQIEWIHEALALLKYALCQIEKTKVSGEREEQLARYYHEVLLEQA